MQLLEINKTFKNIEKHTYHLDLSILDASSLSYDEFFSEYMLKNQVCLIKNIAESWESTKKWTKNDQIDFEYLQNQYGDKQVTIYDCNDKFYNSQKTSSWFFKNYVKYLKSDDRRQILYLKDWHLKNECPDDDFYKVPIYFASDWLNEYLIENKLDDYRFVYMGPKKSWTPFHSDVFSSFSWSVNILGLKKWLIFKPGDENNLKDNFGNFLYDLTQIKNEIPHIELIQRPGDAIFVPTNWYHQVFNEKDTISINHNWINGCNAKKMFEAIVFNLNLVKNEISDCKDMDNFLEHCQVMLKASFGMNFIDFYQFIEYIALKRLNYLKEDCKKIVLFDSYILGKNHVIFDLTAVKDVLDSFVLNEDVKFLVENNCIKDPNCLLVDINKILLK